MILFVDPNGVQNKIQLCNDTVSVRHLTEYLTPIKYPASSQALSKLTLACLAHTKVQASLPTLCERSVLLSRLQGSVYRYVISSSFVSLCLQKSDFFPAVSIVLKAAAYLQSIPHTDPPPLF
jgi:hypothetical protein